jgi:solute:Na+ symporter, SSS family
MDFSLGAADVIIIAGSILSVLLVGLWASRKQDASARGYFLASGKLPWWIIGSAFVSTSVSSEQIVGTVGVAYEHGMGVANWVWCSLPVYTLLMLFFIPVYLKNRVTTVSEFLGRRYGPLCADIYSWVMLVAYVLIFLVPVLYGGSLAFSRLTGWNFYGVLWAMVILVAAYAVKGGLASVMWTDAVQCLMLVGGGLVLFFFAMAKIPGGIAGGWATMAAAHPERFHLYHPANDPIAPFLGLVFGMFGVILFYQAGNQVMIQRVLGARSAWDGQMGILFAGFINFLRPLVTCFLGMIVYHWINVMHMAPALEKNDDAFPFALRELAPAWGLRGIILAGFLAAVMSTISALANSTATLFALDVYRKLINPNADDQRVVRIGRAASLAALVLAALIAPSVERFGGIFRYFQTGVTYLSTPFISVLFLGILWKRTNYQGGLFGVIGGLIIQIAIAVAVPMMGYSVHWLYLAFAAQVLTMLGAVAVSLATPAPPRELWEPFQWSPALLSRYDDGVVRPWYQRLKLWYGIFAAISIYLYWRFW